MRIAYCMLALLLSVPHPACLSGKNVFFGIATIKVSESQEIYVKRMVWGLTSDSSMTVISASKDLYDFREDKTDYVFSSHTGIHYRIENGTLVLYVQGSKARPPERGQFPVKVEQRDVNILDSIEMTRNPEKFGVRFLEITINDQL